MNTVPDFSFLKTIDLTAIKGVLVDFDNTLYRYDMCHTFGINALYEAVNGEYPMTKDVFFEHYNKARETVKERIPNTPASHSRLLYLHAMLEDVSGKSQVEQALTFDDVYWAAYCKQVIPHEEIVNFLKECRNYNTKICLVTDLTASVQFRKMVATGLSSLIDYVVTSEEVGIDKPNAKVFTLALEKLGLQADDVIMIGDDKRKDIDGANDCNIKAYLVKYNHQQ